MAIKRWVLLAFIALVVYTAFVAAQDDDDDERPEGVDGQKIRDVSEGIDAEDAAEDVEDDLDSKDDADTSGVKADTYFPAFADLKVPGGQRIELVIPVSNAVGNPNYEISVVQAHLSTFDHSRFVQNFSAQVYRRVVEAGETTTVKYSVTPDAQLDPNDYAFVVVAFLRTDDNSSQVVVTAYNGTMTVSHPLGFDFKMMSSVVMFFGAIGGAAYFIYTKRVSNRPAPRRSAAAPATPAAVTGTSSSSAYDPDFIDKSHLAYLEARRKRSASPKK